jgi:uncharacterized protein (TIGR00251 family)
LAGKSVLQSSIVNLQSSIPCYNPHVIPIKDTPSGTTFSIKLHPRAKKNAITGTLGDALKVSLTAPPVEGRANEGCIEFFADLLKLPRSSITIAAGQTSRNKLIRIAGLTAAEVEQRLRSVVNNF